MDAYSILSRIYGMENITTEEVMDNLDIFQAIFVKVDEFVCWDLEIIQTDVGTQFTYKDFQQGFFCTSSTNYISTTRPSGN